MKVGDLVKVSRTHGREPIVGLVLEVYSEDGDGSPFPHALVQPCNPEENRLIWANPLDVEVINETR
jgi:hypothetical protein|tara:strand:- start:1249 stop:1446 length:198 start_codon:yes stop_codon:yes gene_type:complete